MKELVLGGGRVGAQLASELASAEHSVAVVDRDQKSVFRLPDTFSGTTWFGDGMDRTALDAAGIADGDAVAAVMYGDNSNIVAARITNAWGSPPSHRWRATGVRHPRFASPGLCGQEGDLLHALVTSAGAKAFHATVLGGPTS